MLTLNFQKHTYRLKIDGGWPPPWSRGWPLCRESAKMGMGLVLDNLLLNNNLTLSVIFDILHFSGKNIKTVQPSQEKLDPPWKKDFGPKSPISPTEYSAFSREGRGGDRRGRGRGVNGFRYCLVKVKWRSSRGTCDVCHSEILFLNKRAGHIDFC